MKKEGCLMENQKKNPMFIFLLALSVCIITPCANEMFLPSLPTIGHYFGTNHSQWIMSVFLIGLGLPQLIYGPLSDRFGRKPVLAAGLLIYTLASLMTATAPSFEVMLIGRFLQAIGACSTVASSMAIARDIYHGDQLIKVISFIFLLIGVFPVISPLLGGVLQVHFGFRGSFYCLFAMGIFYLFVIGVLFSETQKERNHDALSMPKMLRNYHELLTHRQYFGFVFTSGFSYAILFSYSSAAPFILMKELGVSVGTFSLLFAFNAFAIVTMGIIAPKLAIRFGLPKMTVLGSGFLLLGTFLLLACNAAFGPKLLSVVIPMFTAMLGVGIIRPTASAGAMSLFPPRIAGSAASIFNLVSFLAGGASTFIVALIPHITPISYAILGLVLSFFACLSARQTLLMAESERG